MYIAGIWDIAAPSTLNSHFAFSLPFRKAKALVNKVVEDAGGTTSMPSMASVFQGSMPVSVYMYVHVCMWAVKDMCMHVSILSAYVRLMWHAHINIVFIILTHYTLL